MARRGRPRRYASDNEKLKAYRDAKKAGGAVRVGCYLPLEYKDLLKKFCQETGYSMSEAICFLIESYYNKETTDGKTRDQPRRGGDITKDS